MQASYTYIGIVAVRYDQQRRNVVTSTERVLQTSAEIDTDEFESPQIPQTPDGFRETIRELVRHGPVFDGTAILQSQISQMRKSFQCLVELQRQASTITDLQALEVFRNRFQQRVIVPN